MFHDINQDFRMEFLVRGILKPLNIHISQYIVESLENKYLAQSQEIGMFTCSKIEKKKKKHSSCNCMNCITKP